MLFLFSFRSVLHVRLYLSIIEYIELQWYRSVIWFGVNSQTNKQNHFRSLSFHWKFYKRAPQTT